LGFWQGQRVVISGGAGVIGSYLAEHLVAAGASVRIVDNLENGHLGNLAAIRDRIEFIAGDVTDMSVSQAACAGMDVMMNMAAQAPGVGHSHLNHVPLLGRNVQIGSVILEAARQQGVGRALVVSSSCVYPDEAPVPTPELPVFTGEPERVNSGYGWAKRYQELQAQHYAAQFGMQIAIARPFNAYGGRDIGRGEQSHVIPAIIERILSDEPELMVWGSGTQTRSFIHARDIAQGLALVTEHYAVADAVNVGHDHETTMAELARLLLEVAEVEKPIVFDTSKPEGCKRKSADMTKFRRVTHGFEPVTELRDGLREMVEAHRAMRAG